MEDNINTLQMENDLNMLRNIRKPCFFPIGRRPQYFAKWKTTSIFWHMEDDLNILESGTKTSLFWKT
jgi:hypothetical protein